MKKKIIIIASIISVLVIIIAAVVVSLFVEWEKFTYDIEEYSAVRERYEFLPAIDELGDGEDLSFTHFKKSQFIFSSNSYTLTVKCSDSEFIDYKKKFDAEFVYEENKIKHDKDEVEKEPSFELDSFEFKTLSFKKYRIEYPRQIVFVGFSDEKNEIVFVVFEDEDRDYIEGSFEDCLKSDCGWQ